MLLVCWSDIMLLVLHNAEVRSHAILAQAIRYQASSNYYYYY